MIDAASDTSALDLALLGADGDPWADLIAFPASLDDPLASKASSEATLSPSLSSAPSPSSPVEEALMDYVDAAAASPEHSAYAQYLVSDATGDSDNSLMSAADAVYGRLTQSHSATASSASGPAPIGTQSLLSTLWKQKDAETSAMSSVTENAPPSPLMWANPTPALMRVDAKQLPNADTMEIRRLKNRECMRRARQRQREDYKLMKATVARLEKQYAELCVRAAPTLDDAVTISSLDVKTETGDTHSTKKREKQRYAAAVALSKRLGAENLYLKSGLQRHAAWKQHLHRILDSSVGSFADISDAVGAPFSASSLTQNTAAPSIRTSATAKSGLNSPTTAQRLEELDAQEAAAIFNFSPFGESAVGRAIIDNAHVTQEIRASLLAAVQAKDPRVKRHDVLGWDVIQRVRGTLMEYSFTKTFKDLDINGAGQKMWMNDMRMDTFRVILYSLRRLDVLQQVSPNAYILGRDVTYPDCSTVYRSLFMRFRTQVNREIPNGSLPPLKATGFVIGTHSLNRDWSCSSSSPRHASYHPGAGSRPGGLDEGESLDWLDMALVTEFLTIEDPTTGEKYYQIQWMGRTDPKSHAEAMRNAPDTLTVCLRTELLMVGPAVRLLRSA